MTALCDSLSDGKCSQCGLTLREGLRRTCSAIKRPQKERSQRAQLGDFTERMLKKIGITEDRYKEAKEKFGLAPTCNCADRKDWLNRVGKYFGIG